MHSVTPEQIAIATLLVLVLVQTVRLAWRRSAAARRLARHRAQGAEGERVAERLLEREGYVVVARQPTARVVYLADGERCAFDVRADLVVERDGVRSIAEVKTGEQAAALTSRATRRQLLEYTHAFGVEQVLLVDAQRGRISAVRVPTRGTIREVQRGLRWLVVGVVCGVALVPCVRALPSTIARWAAQLEAPLRHGPTSRTTHDETMAP